MNTMVSLVELRCEINRMREDRAALADKQKRELESADREIAKKVEEFENWRKGLDPERIALAQKVIQIHGSYANGGAERDSAVQEAIDDIADWNCKKLREHTFSTKSYDRWHGQRCDCEYGYGPKHGHIIFSIGLTPEIRRRDPICLTDEEDEAAIYYLANLADIEASRAAGTNATLPF